MLSKRRIKVLSNSVRGPLNDCQDMRHMKRMKYIMTETIGEPTSHRARLSLQLERTLPCSLKGLFLAAQPQGPRGRDLPQGARGARRDSKKTGMMQYMEAALGGPDENLKHV